MDLERDSREEREKRERRDMRQTGERRADLARPAFLASLAFLATMLGACKMGPDYVRSETPTADSWRVATSTAESIANLAWWELLKDKELQNLIRIALAENQDVRTAIATVEEYRAQLVMTRFDLAPSLSYGGTTFLYQTSGNATTIPGGGGAIVIPGQQGGSGARLFRTPSASAV